MKPVSPVIPGSIVPEVKYAEHQPQYLTLPSIRTPDGVVLSRWELDDAEIQKIVHTRSVYLALHTFNQPLQPIIMSVEPPPTFDYATYSAQTLPKAEEAEKPAECACDFPKIVYRNMNGHHPTCPVYIAWAEKAYRQRPPGPPSVPRHPKDNPVG